MASTKKYSEELTMAAAQISLLIVYMKYNYKGLLETQINEEVLENNIEVKRANAIINYKLSS
jgi:hypothetical protein